MRSILPPSSGTKSKKNDKISRSGKKTKQHFNTEDEGSMFLRNACELTLNYMGLLLRR
jgi:hypothetical protein